MRKKVMAWLLVLTLTIANSNLVYAVDTAPQINEENSSSDEEQESNSGTNEDGAEDTTSKPNEEADKNEENQEQSLDEQQAGNASTENKNVETENIEGIEEKATAPLIEATETSGKCGENAYWEYDDGTKTLTISGSGAMEDYARDMPAPWNKFGEWIQNIVVGEAITTIGEYAFYCCADVEVKTFTIKGNINYVGTWGLIHAEKLIVGSKVTYLKKTFYYLTDFKIIEVEPENSVYSSKDGVLFDKEQKTLIRFPYGTDITSYVIPDSVVKIREHAFFSCRQLEQVELPSGLERIGYRAFETCIKLEKIVIPDSVKMIEECSFFNCEGLRKIIFGKREIEIGDWAFAYTDDVEVYFKGEVPKKKESDRPFHASTVKAYYPQNNLTWTADVRKSYGENVTWIPWLPDEQKHTTSIAGKEEHYLSGQTNYETVDELEKIDNGYSVLKNSTWKVTKTMDMSGDVLYIRSGAEVKVSGTLRAKEIVVEKGGRLSVNSKGKVTADKVTAKGGWFGDDWFGGNDSSGGMVDINSGTLQADNLNFEGRSTLHVHENGKIIAKRSMKMNTGSDGSELESGKVFIGGELTVKGKNYVAQDSSFGTVFYNSGAVLKKSGKDFCLGAVYVVDDNTFLNMNLESKNFLSAMKCKVSANWSLSNLQKIAGADYSESWNTSVESALGNINSQAAFNCVHSQLSDEECRYVEDLAAVWTTVLLAPACDGLLESKSAVCEMEFKINKKTCKLKLQGMNTGGYAKLAGVYLSVNGSDFQQIGMIANANIDEFSKKAKEYLVESAKKEIIGYASGKAAGAISSRATINKDIVKKLVEKCAKKVCLNEAIFNETENSEIKQIKKSFKVVDLLIRSTGTRTAFNVQAGNGLTTVLNSEQVQTIMTKDSLDEPIINEFSDKVTDEWLKIRLIEILGKDASGEPDLSKASEITTLDLSKGYIRDLSGLQHFTNLKELNLADNEVQDLSPLAGLTKLETLNVSGQFISNLYPISELKNLTALDISENEITTLSSIGHLEKLKILNATDNRLTVINSLSNLKALEKISLSNNPLSEGAMTALACLGNVSSVEANNCGIDKLTGIPVVSLKELYVSNNNLENLSGLSEAKMLEILDVSHNYLTNAEELSSLTALVQLDMRGNGLTNIAGLKNLLNLKELYLGQNGIVDKDLDYLAGMLKLEKLDLSDNLIFGLDWRKDLSILKEVNVSNTALDKQDVRVLEETGLKVIDDSEIPLLKDIYFLNTKVNLNVGNCYMQEVLTYPSDAMTNEIMWSSSNEEVVAVDKDGIITALKKGTATVTARLADEEKAVSYEVTVAASDKGDINGDNEIDILDILACLDHTSEKEVLTGTAHQAADVVEDGIVDIFDLMKLLDYVNERIDSL